MHQKNIELGKIGEDIAAVYLQDLGYEILDRNWRFKRVELDIVAHLDSTLVFCEVKTRRSTHELAIHFGAEIDFLDLQAALTLLEIRKVVALSNQGWKLI